MTVCQGPGRRRRGEGVRSGLLVSRMAVGVTRGCLIQKNDTATQPPMARWDDARLPRLPACQPIIHAPRHSYRRLATAYWDCPVIRSEQRRTGGQHRDTTSSPDACQTGDISAVAIGVPARAKVARRPLEFTARRTLARVSATVQVIFITITIVINELIEVGRLQQ